MVLSNETSVTNLTPIQQFYADSEIFITGGTGFLGTILVEKLLRVCPNIQTIYLLMRSKDGLSPDDRLITYFDNMIFNKMKTENPNYRMQVVCVQGDISEDGLGLNKNDRNTLIEKVNIVFHVAATINFKEKLQKSILINIRGTREVLTLSKEMKNLKFITHVSTAYVHCEQTVLDEKFYKPPFKANELISLAENMSAKHIDKLTSILMGNFPNTYSFTKTVSEELIEACTDLPIAILRPAIVVSTLNEPIPGWINNFQGPTLSTTATMMGLVRSLSMDSKIGSNIVPVDMCTNMLIAIPWQCRNKYETVIKSQQTYKIEIYNYESNTYQYLSVGNCYKLTEHYNNIYPPVKMIGECFTVMTKSRTLYTIISTLFHYLPALIIDTVFKFMRKKSNLLKQYIIIEKLNIMFSYFVTRDWNYKSNNLIELCDSMSPEDNKIFFCDLRKLDWTQYFKTYILGLRTYLLKDDLSTITYAKKRHFCIKVATRSILLMMSYFLISVFPFKFLMNLGNAKSLMITRLYKKCYKLVLSPSV